MDEVLCDIVILNVVLLDEMDGLKKVVWDVIVLGKFINVVVGFFGVGKMFLILNFVKSILDKILDVRFLVLV